MVWHIQRHRERKRDIENSVTVTFDLVKKNSSKQSSMQAYWSHEKNEKWQLQPHATSAIIVINLHAKCAIAIAQKL